MVQRLSSFTLRYHSVNEKEPKWMSSRWLVWMVGYAADFKTIIFNTKAIKIHYIWYYYFILSIINV